MDLGGRNELRGHHYICQRHFDFCTEGEKQRKREREKERERERGRERDMTPGNYLLVWPGIFSYTSKTRKKTAVHSYDDITLCLFTEEKTVKTTYSKNITQ